MRTFVPKSEAVEYCAVRLKHSLSLFLAELEPWPIEGGFDDSTEPATYKPAPEHRIERVIRHYMPDATHYAHAVMRYRMSASEFLSMWNGKKRLDCIYSAYQNTFLPIKP